MSQGIFVKDNKASSGDVIFPWLFGLIGVSIAFAAQFLAVFVLVFAGLDYNKYEGLYYLAYGILALLTIPWLIKFSAKVYSDKKSGLMIKTPKATEVMLVIAFAFGLLGIVSVYMNIVTLMSEHMNTVKDQLDVYSESIDRFNEITPEEVPLFDQILDYVSTVIVIPVFEELLYRGVILGQFRKAYSGWFSILISAVVFVLMHGISVHIGYALICGILLGMIYYLTSNLFLTIIAHVLFNFFGGALPVMLDSGLFNIPEETAKRISAFFTVFSIYMLPAVFFVIAIFILRYKNAEKKNREITVDSISDGTRTANVGDFAASKDNDDKDGENNSITFVIK